MTVPYRNIIQYDSSCFSSDQKYVYLPRPLSECNQSNIEYNNSVKFGKYGDRLHSHIPNSTSLPKDRIIIVGDSHAMGWGVSGSDIFAHHLSKSGIQSINLSVSSYGTVKELSRLKDFKEKYPDLFSRASTIVIQYNANDYGENAEFLLNGEKYILNPPKSQVSDFKNLLGAANLVHVSYNSPWFLLLTSLPAASKTIRLFYEYIFSIILRYFLINFFAPIAGQANKELIVTHARQSEAFFKVLRAYRDTLHGKRIIVFISNRWGESNSSLSEEFALKVSAINNQISYPDESVSIIMPFVNIRPGLGYYYLDDHLNPIGHNIISKSIAAELARSRVR